MIVNDTGLFTNSMVGLNGADYTTTFVSLTQLTVAILAADITAAATAQEKVFTRTPGSGTSSPKTFTIN